MKILRSTSKKANKIPVRPHKSISPPKPLGVRERSRLETIDRIIVTARRLLAEQGYDATTTRQVALKAGLGVGTLFNYVKDKRDLIYLIFNKEIRVVTDVSLAAPRPWETFQEKILSIFEHHYRFFGSEPVLSRILLTETIQHAPGFHLQEFLTLRDAIIDGVEKIVAVAQTSGEIKSEAHSSVIARSIFFVHSANVRWWLDSPDLPDWRVGLREFAKYLDLQLKGLT